jgi:hypothetical protein
MDFVRECNGRTCTFDFKGRCIDKKMYVRSDDGTPCCRYDPKAILSVTYHHKEGTNVKVS